MSGVVPVQRQPGGMGQILQLGQAAIQAKNAFGSPTGQTQTPTPDPAQMAQGGAVQQDGGQLATDQSARQAAFNRRIQMSQNGGAGGY